MKKDLIIKRYREALAPLIKHCIETRGYVAAELSLSEQDLKTANLNDLVVQVNEIRKELHRIIEQYNLIMSDFIFLEKIDAPWNFLSHPFAYGGSMPEEMTKLFGPNLYVYVMTSIQATLDKTLCSYVEQHKNIIRQYHELAPPINNGTAISNSNETKSPLNIFVHYTDNYIARSDFAMRRKKVIFELKWKHFILLKKMLVNPIFKIIVEDVKERYQYALDLDEILKETENNILVTCTYRNKVKDKHITRLCKLREYLLSDLICRGEKYKEEDL